MLTFSFNGETIFSYESARRSVQSGNPNAYMSFTLEVYPRASVGTIRRFVTRLLMTGVKYNDAIDKQLAAVIFAAIAHPRLRYIEHSSRSPMWFTRIVGLAGSTSRNTTIGVKPR